jgi:hypothetical protein
LILQASLHAAFRVHQRPIINSHPHRSCAGEIARKGLPMSRWIRRQQHCDRILAWRKPKQRTKWMTADQFAPNARTPSNRPL